MPPASAAGRTSLYLSKRLDLAKEVAVGLEEGLDIAIRLGFSEAEWHEIEHRPDFTAEVLRIRSDMEKSGQMFRIKAAVMADKLLDNTFASAMSGDIPVKDKVAALQQLTRIGGLETSSVVQQSGPGFSITINLPTPVQTVEEDVIQIKPVVVEELKAEPLTIGFKEHQDDDDGKRDDGAVKHVGNVGDGAGGDGELQG